MAETTRALVRSMLGGLVGVQDGEIDVHLGDAKQVVLDDGITENDPNFERMHRFMTAHHLTLTGLNQEVSSESVEDTSRSLVANVRSEGSSSFLKLYEERLIKIFNIGDRIAVDV